MRNHETELKNISEGRQCCENTERRSTLNSTKHVHQEATTKYLSLGCIGDILNLTCPQGKTVFIVDAHYGKYEQACSSCCPRHFVNDCTERVAESGPSDWVAMKLLCDNQTACAYENRGSTVHSCEVDYVADFLEIEYACLPHHTSPQAVAFSAVLHHDELRLEVAPNTVIAFKTVITNVGGFYNEQMGTFVCPYNGIYQFTINVQTSNGDTDRVDVQLYVNDTPKAYSFAYLRDTSEYFDATSTTVNTECFAGNRVWLATLPLFQTAVHTPPLVNMNIFSGVLIYNYDF